MISKNVNSIGEPRGFSSKETAEAEYEKIRLMYNSLLEEKSLLEGKFEDFIKKAYAKDRDLVKSVLADQALESYSLEGISVDDMKIRRKRRSSKHVVKQKRPQGSWNIGRKLSAETRKKMSDAHKKRNAMIKKEIKEREAYKTRVDKIDYSKPTMIPLFDKEKGDKYYE